MSDLQTGLLAIGIFLVVAIIALNKWQERRIARNTQELFPGSDRDALLEPTLGKRGREAATPEDGDAWDQSTLPAPGIDTRGSSGVASDPWNHPTVQAPGSAARAATGERDEVDEPDPEFDLVVEASFPMAVGGDQLRPFAANLRHAGRKPVRLYGMTTAGKHRSSLHATERYASLMAAVQLANRSGPLTATEYSEFVAKVQSLCDRLEGVVEVPDMKAVLERAAEIDAKFAALDAVVGLTLISTAGPWSGDDVAAAARECAMTLQGDGRFHHLDASGRTLHALAHPSGVPYIEGALETVRSPKLSLLLDVPRFAEQEAPFTQMTATGQRLASLLRAELVDDNNRPVNPQSAGAVDSQVVSFYQQLAAARVSAGSARAQRLFA